MPAITRFYQPARGQYQSQFVPKELPIDLMAKTLYAKQALADKMAAETIKLGDWQHEALGWHDTNYVKNIKNEIQDFATRAMTQDRTSPEFQREYFNLTNRIKNDENLSAISESVKKHNDYLKRHEELTKMGDEAAVDALEADYLYRLNEYTKEGGEGFKGMPLADPNIRKGTNVFKDSLEFFTPLKESGAENIKFLGSGIAYKNGWSGISDPRVVQQAKRQYDLWENTDAAKQLRTQRLVDLGYVDTKLNQLPKEEKAKINADLDNYLHQKFLDVGRTVVHGNSTTNIDDAYNSQRGEELEKLKDMPVIIPTNQEKEVTTESAADRHSVILEMDYHLQNTLKKIEADKKRVENGLPSNYTKAEWEGLLQQSASYKRQKEQLTLEANRDYNNIYNAQKSKVVAKHNNLIDQQNQVLRKLSSLASPEDLAVLRKQLHVNINNDAGNFSELGRIYQHLPENSRARGLVQKLMELEEQKINLGGIAKERTDNLWAKEYNKQKTIVTTEPTGVTIRTDATSVAKAADKDMASNPTSWEFRSQNNKPLILGKHTTILETKTNSAADETGEFNTSLKIRRPKINSEGDIIINDKTKAIEYEEVWVNAKATPVNEDTKVWINNKLANEQLALSDLKRKQGFTDEAELAFKHGVNLSRQSIKGSLMAFKRSNNAATTVQANVKAPNGSVLTEFYIEKIGDGEGAAIDGTNQGGGYRLKYGKIEQEFENVDEVNAYIQTLTGL